MVAYQGVAYVGVSSAEENLAAFIPGYPCCDFRGSVVALKVDTGEILWKTFTVPDLPGYSGAGVWGGTPAVDVRRRSLYVTSGNNYSRPQGSTDCIAGVIATVPPGPDRDQAMRDCDPHYVDNHFDSILALDLDTGAIKWATHTLPEDAWNVACIIPDALNAACPENAGPDYDFAQAPVLYTAKISGVKRDVLGVGQKSGDFWGLDPDTGSIVWHTVVGPGGVLGGIQWGSATDGKLIYAAISNFNNTPWILQGGGPFAGQEVSHGFWSALDGATGALLWQSPDPNIAMDTGALTVANDVLFAGSMGSTRGAASEDTMFALNSKTGEILWRYPSGGSVNSSPAVVNGVVYWGSGYNLLGLIGTSNYRLYAFSTKRHGREQSHD